MPKMSFISVVLPAPFSADQGVDLAMLNREIDVVVGVDAVGINLVNGLRFDNRH